MLLGETLVRHFLGRGKLTTLSRFFSFLSEALTASPLLIDWRLGYNRKHIVSQYTEVFLSFFPFSSYALRLVLDASFVDHSKTGSLVVF